MTILKLWILSSFNSRTREGCDQSGVGLDFTNFSFNSRTREGCDDQIDDLKIHHRFQFTHPRGVRFTIPYKFVLHQVSIHAPARGAIPTHATRTVRGCFNSRTREGCDGFPFGSECKGSVSIHAPARGAITANKNKAYRGRFQFTHPRGVRFITKAVKFGIVVSIHAPARGAISANIARHIKGCFNSRTREGCDFKSGTIPISSLVSIHAPARGAIGLQKNLIK